MSKFAGHGVSVLVGILVMVAGSAMADGSSYNDLAWATGQPSTAITTYSPLGTTNGLLVTYPSNATTSIRVGITGSAASAIYPESIPAGSDAYVAFNGKLSCSNGIYWSAGNIVLTFTGLNPAKTYDLAAYSSRGYASPTYSNRFTVATLSDVTSFANNSSTGAVKSTTTMSNDTTKIVAGNLTGMIYKYTAINPGSDGDMQMSFSPIANPGNGTNGYLNAFMLVETTPAPVLSGPVLRLK